MFINTGKFKKMITNAWKLHHFIVGCVEGKYFFSDGACIISVYRDMLPNKEKAAVIELIGELPEEGQVMKTGKDMPSQYMVMTDMWDVEKTFEKCQCSMTVTRSLYQGSLSTYRVIQNRKDQKCFFVDNYFIDLFDRGAWTEDDFEPEGPKTLNDSPGTLYWRNETMTFAVYPISVPEDNEELSTYLNLLENMELPEDKYL